MISFVTWATPGFRGGCVNDCAESIDNYCLDKTNERRIIPNIDYKGHRHPSWFKLKLIGSCLESWEQDWVVWIDADSYIINRQLSVNEWFFGLPKSVHCVVGHDWNGICCAFIAVRQSQWSIDFIKTIDWLGTTNDGMKWEQGTIKTFFQLAVEHQHRLFLAPSNIWSDITRPSSPEMFCYHHGNACAIPLLKAGETVGGMLHGITY